jgi:sialate O-acetylesterase
MKKKTINTLQTTTKNICQSLFGFFGSVVLTAFLVITQSPALFADVKLPEIFANGMVLQRDLPVPIWGFASPNEKITVTFGEQTHTATTDENGNWKLKLLPLKASEEPQKLTIKANNTITLDDILVGEVWLCSGQSNMEWSMQKHPDSRADIPNVNNPKIRLFQVAHTWHKEPQKSLKPNIIWKPANPENVKNFSSIGYYFGTELNKALNVPIGLIDSSWGGTRIEPWIPLVGFEGVNSLSDIAGKLKDVENFKPNNQQQPSVLYNQMIHPLVPLALRGAIWYQGESNMGETTSYTDKMHALVNGWRNVFQNDELAFYYVQLAPYKKYKTPDLLPKFWVAQSIAEEQIPKTGMAIINDIGNIDDIHPQKKKIVANRLARLALNKTYGKKDVICESPKFDSLTISENSITINFKNAKELKTNDGNKPNWFEIAGEDGNFQNAEAEIFDKNKVKLKTGNIKKPKSVRFAWKDVAEPNLQNEAELPLGTFTTKIE